MEIEKETILLMSKGDKKAYETMFRRFYPKVRANALNFLPFNIYIFKLYLIDY